MMTKFITLVAIVSVYLAFATSDPSTCPSLLQTHSKARKDTSASCSPLQNHGSYSTVLVQVGTPPQKFNLVADTGSDDVIVQSCLCQEKGNCPSVFGNCFNQKSSSFSINMLQKGGRTGAPEIMMSFGSGNIDALITSDIVKVGDASTFMNNSLLLMVDQQLSFDTSMFEGIIGLGRPMSKKLLAAYSPEESKILPFLQAAGVERFSVCFNDNNADGVLGVNTLQQQSWLGSVGTLHWGLSFEGISVGSSTQKALFCLPGEKLPGQQTACGIIPDSGTTLIMGPSKQLRQLYNTLCEQWGRCKYIHDAMLTSLEGKAEHKLQEFLASDSRFVTQGLKSKLRQVHAAFTMTNTASDVALQQLHKSAIAEVTARKPTKAEIFQLLLKSCGSWMDEDTDLDSEMPQLFFQVAGLEGNKESLAIKPFNYVIESTEDMAEQHMNELHGKLPMLENIGMEERVCMPAFGSLDYPTTLNGPVWLLGTPVFYAYDVNYNRASNPPGMFFSPTACGSCVDGNLQRPVASMLGLGGYSRLRKVTQAIRMKKVDVTKPF